MNLLNSSSRTHLDACGFLTKGKSARSKAAGFTMLELLVAIAVLGIISAIGILVTTGVSNSARSTQIQSSISTINQAIDVYVSTGGSLDGLTTPAQVLAKLKTTRSRDDRKRHIGAGSGRMIDPRLVAIWDSSKEASADEPLAVYDVGTERFVMKTSGTGGVTTFRMDSSLNEMAIAEESRDGEVFAYSANDTWVWDYKRLDNPDGINGPDTINTTDQAPSTGPPSGPGTTPGAGTSPGTSTPGTSTPGTSPGGTAGSAGTGTPGTTPGSSGPGTVGTGDPGGDPEPDPIKLGTPNFSKTSGGYPSDQFPLAVSISNLPSPGSGQTVYKLGSGAWQSYGGGTVTVPANVTLYAQNIAISSDYTDSSTRSATFYPTVSSFSGNSQGVFSGATGGGGDLVASYTNGGSFFSHGDPTIDLGGEIVDAGTANTLEFLGGSIGSTPDEWFTIGNLRYHNGTTFSDSHATYVELEISINLTSPVQTLTTTLSLDLINTENSENANESADIVQISGFDAVGFTVEGTSYSLQLEFGGTDSFGFSTGNKFHVFEGATGNGEIRGRFKEN